MFAEQFRILATLQSVVSQKHCFCETSTALSQTCTLAPAFDSIKRYQRYILGILTVACTNYCAMQGPPTARLICKSAGSFVCRPETAEIWCCSTKGVLINDDVFNYISICYLVCLSDFSQIIYSTLTLGSTLYVSQAIMCIGFWACE